MITSETIVDYFVARAQQAYPHDQDREKSAEDLRAIYAKLKSKTSAPRLDSSQRAIYGVTRLAGTLAAMTKVLDVFREKNLSAPKSILDCGSGPGTALFASFLQFGEQVSYLGLEKDPHFIAMAANAINDLLPDVASQFRFIEGIIPHRVIDESFDLTIFSYILSETPADQLARTINFALQHTAQYLLITDAGTPQVYRQLMEARNLIIAEGWSIIAPCPHQFACPLAVDDFCHFPARFIRHEEARRLKKASAQAEDEKYCYLIAQAPGLHKAEPEQARIINHPIKRSGHVILDVCATNGSLKRHILSKKKHPAYGEIKKTMWGDEINLDGFNLRDF